MARRSVPSGFGGAVASPRAENDDGKATDDHGNHPVLQVVAPLTGFFPLIAEAPTDRHPHDVPRQRTRRSEKSEPSNGHFLRTGGNRNDGTHDGYQSSEENDCRSMALEPLEAFVNVGLLQAEVLTDTGQQFFESIFVNEATECVEKVRADDRTDGGRDDAADEIESALADVEAGEEENELGGDRRKDILESNENSDSDESNCIDDVGSPIDHP